MKYIITLFVLLLIPFLSSAQDSKFPSEEMSLGFMVQSGSESFGILAGYAFTPDLQVGLGLGAAFDTGDDKETQSFDGGLSLYLEPYARMYFEPSRNFRPFIMGSVAISSVPTLIAGTGLASKTVNEDKTKIYISVGGEWYPYKSVAVGGGIRFFNFITDESRMIIGLGSPFLMINWFL